VAGLALTPVVRVVLTAGVIGTITAGIGTAGSDRGPLELRVFAYATLDSAGVTVARQTAQALLGAGGLRTSWRDCGSSDRCADSVRAGAFVRVHLLPVARSSDPSISADAVPSSSGPRVALVYMPNLSDTLTKILRSPASRSTPELATLSTAHLAGVAIAHEVGHTLGLGHTSVGVMKAQLDADDIVAARRHRLGFSPSERVSLRQALKR
jgi:hypothetical protein